MKCDKHMNRFLELDNGDHLPLTSRFHLLVCPRCRREVSAMTIELAILRDSAPHYADADLSRIVMEKIFTAAVGEEHFISNLKWIIVGFIMMISTVLIGYSDTTLWLRDHFGPNLIIPLSIVLGLTFSCYAVMFVGTHIDELKKYRDQIIRKIQ